ncbi:MAG: hypothetical protein ACK5D9_06185 [Burkholderiales bacterium]|jgi:hypothetical protein
MTRGIQIAAIIIGAILFSGLIWGAFAIVETWLVRGELPKGEWWHFVVAIPIIGVVALAFEALGAGIGHAFGINKPGTPKWKEYLGVVTTVAAIVALLVIFKLVRS